MTCDKQQILQLIIYTLSRETIITFVYDTQMLQQEVDDPASAILYFHPTWVSDQQKAALCGQIVGTIQCVKNILSTPEVVSLQSGKFSVIEKGRYLLAVGTDRNINDWLLKHRARTLYSLVNFFHKDFELLASIYKNGSLSAKLYHMFETYLKMIAFGGNIFSHIPSLSLPKSASSVFLEAVHLLQCCQEFNHVLGGLILYHNKVVATQLGANLSKLLVLADPYRIKCPAEVAEVSYDTPLGVQLLQVYICNRDYSKLLESSLKNENICQYLGNKSIKKNYNKVQDAPIVSAMKRDQSLIFTAVPEEGPVSSADPPFVITKKVRPKFLNLKSISIESSVKVIPVKQAVTTPFHGQTSVCSTPMTELKKFVHQNPLSICRNDDATNGIFENGNKTEIEFKGDKFLSEAALKESVPYVNITSNVDCGKRYKSLFDIHGVSKDASPQYLNVKGPVHLDLSPVKKGTGIKKRFKTIADPTFPVFKTDGTVISHPYYNMYLKNNLEIVQLDAETNHSKEFHVCAKKNRAEQEQEITKTISRIDTLDKLPKVSMRNNKEHRKSLTLPLKSFGTDTTQTPSEPLMKRYSSGVQLTPLMSKLSMLAFEERSSGFCSGETTPCDYRGLTPTQPNYFACHKYKGGNRETGGAKTEGNRSLQKCLMFVCGQQDVVLVVLLKEECFEESGTVRKLWDVCTEHLGKLEKQLNYCMESQSGDNTHESEPYSYLCLDSVWDTVKRGGPWGTNDLGALNIMHSNFDEVHTMTEVMMRGGDSVIYGYHCGPSEVYYHESASTTAGLPPPADPLGLVQLKAKRRLERDHSIILL
ncbi:hypothetical protein NQ315_001426 [Exocentrus adspersus]|uniref:Hermansky-Pudlak syndrome 4 protein n=1 Tax=Exocentrus adspersus TaxID=1586481 RepID=A0AAV8WF33_9CUCU|nr:hypothetical protein NQ315_001426 [Exocentrus adspersus]